MTKGWAKGPGKERSIDGFLETLEGRASPDPPCPGAGCAPHEENESGETGGLHEREEVGAVSEPWEAAGGQYRGF